MRIILGWDQRITLGIHPATHGLRKAPSVVAVAQVDVREERLEIRSQTIESGSGYGLDDGIGRVQTAQAKAVLACETEDIRVQFDRVAPRGAPARALT
eukprot:CAMPEP_0115872034 /NCGR_PEP_ID=MMETSP0287-20121206/23204_1 /TAXON_ID=412157 /ORGANISM="Chrysochromulina rotalis, Strain UIO044" /LENGTH=97 /DNA_ID=CAMNT_0003326915 /DNA_START=539 /DNA_END=832 /DNA_ORIENTATION=+